MPCWVVPAVASEIWHVPLEQILQAVRAGQIPSKHENGFTFIDVAPGAPRAETLATKPSHQLRAQVTYKVHKPRREEREAGDPIPIPQPADVISPHELEVLHGEEDLQEVGAIDQPLSMGDWRRGRRTAQQRRRAPAA